MAKVKITGHASGSGVITVTAPNTSTDRTITLPDGDVTLGAAVGGASGVDFNDSVKARFGNGNDYQLYHDGSDSYVVADNTTTLKIRNTDGNIELQPKTGEVGVKAIADGAVELYHNNVKKLETTAAGITATGNGSTVLTKSAIGTAAHEAGAGFQNTGHATQSSRRAIMWLDADGANFSGSDYYYIEKTGGGGVQHILQNSGEMKFATNGSTRMTIDPTGAVTMPAQPAFLANAATMNNIAVNTDTTVIFSTERFDQNSDFNPSNYTFTAPVTGKYLLTVQILLAPFPIDANYIDIILRTSNRNTEFLIDPRSYDQSPAYHTLGGSFLVDMDAGDTSYVDFAQSAGSATTDISNVSFFSGYLAC